MNPRKLMQTLEAELGGGGGSLTGAGVGLISTVPVGGDGDSSPDGAGDGVGPSELGGGGELDLFLSAKTTTTTFSFLQHLSLFPLMKQCGPDLSNVKTVWPSSNFLIGLSVLQLVQSSWLTRSTQSWPAGQTKTTRYQVHVSTYLED